MITKPFAPAALPTHQRLLASRDYHNMMLYEKTLLESIIQVTGVDPSKSSTLHPSSDCYSTYGKKLRKARGWREKKQEDTIRAKRDEEEFYLMLLQ
jgi:hypothetical protein